MSRYTITNGPSKWDLMRFLFDASRYSTLLSFKIASCYGDLVPIKITGIDKENDSG